MNDPVIIALIAAAVGVVGLSIVGWIWQHARQAARDTRQRVALREQRGYLQKQQAEIERLASKIIATSSTDTIAGFEIIRQIEAVFTDGHASPNKAVEQLKAAAAEKGANAIINLNSVRPPAGKYVALGDAVIVKPLEQKPSSPTLPPLPSAD